MVCRLLAAPALVGRVDCVVCKSAEHFGDRIFAYGPRGRKTAACVMKSSPKQTLRILCTAALLAPALHAAPIIGPATPVAEFNTLSSEQLTDLSANGLTAILQSNGDDVRIRIYSSTRATVSDPWSVPSNVDFAATNSSTNVGHAILSADGLELFYQHNPNLRTTTRASNAVPFPAGAVVPELSIGGLGGYERPGKLSADGLRMYLEVFMSGGSVDLYVATRSSVLDPWGTPVPGPFAANINDPFAVDLEPCVTPDELQLFYASNRAGSVGGSVDVWWASRASISDPFSAPVNLASMNTTSQERSPELFGSTLFFTSDRNGTSDVFTAPVVPEPGSLALLLAGGIGAVIVVFEPAPDRVDEQFLREAAREGILFLTPHLLQIRETFQVLPVRELSADLAALAVPEVAISSVSIISCFRDIASRTHFGVALPSGFRLCVFAHNTPRLHTLPITAHPSSAAASRGQS